MTNQQINSQNDDLNDDIEKELGAEGIELKKEEEMDFVADDSAEEYDDDDDDEGSDDAIKKLKLKLKNALEEKQKYLHSWQRDKADFINARKREEEAKREFLKMAEANLIAELIPVLDSFDMAMSNKEAWEKADKNWRVGVEYIHSQLVNTLMSHGLSKINPLGRMFDPSIHHSVSVIPTDKKEEDHMILDVVSSGYMLNGKVLKAPQVKVGEYKKIT
jgi:molecular chaperone GrpE